jgi:hypothetical protein
MVVIPKLAAKVRRLLVFQGNGNFLRPHSIARQSFSLHLANLVQVSLRGGVQLGAKPSFQGALADVPILRQEGRLEMHLGCQLGPVTNARDQWGTHLSLCNYYGVAGPEFSNS